MPQTNEKEWWYDEHFGNSWAGCFECCDYESLLEKINSIVSEAERRGYERALMEIKQTYPRVSIMFQTDWGREDSAYLVPKSFFEAV